MTLSELGSALRDHQGVTMFHHEAGWMVSLKRNNSFRVFYGQNLPETMLRALANGPQHPPKPDWDDLI